MEPAHQWIRGRRRADRLTLLARLDLPPVLAVVDAHRRLNGPYSAAGALLRHLVPPTLAHVPCLVRRHDTELRSVAPDLSAVLPATGGTAAVVAPAVLAGTGFHTLRLAHGLTEFVRAQHRARALGPVTLVFDSASEADPTDQEFLAVLLRRLDPAEITVVVGTGRELRATSSPEQLGTALALRCLAHTAAAADPGPLPADPAAAFVAGDGVSDDPRLLRAYQELDPTRRARLHDQRAAELVAAGTALGALAWHRRHGSAAAAGAVRDRRPMAG
jgi:hypothetical protein